MAENPPWALRARERRTWLESACPEPSPCHLELPLTWNLTGAVRSHPSPGQLCHCLQRGTLPFATSSSACKASVRICPSPAGQPWVEAAVPAPLPSPGPPPQAVAPQCAELSHCALAWPTGSLPSWLVRYTLDFSNGHRSDSVVKPCFLMVHSLKSMKAVCKRSRRSPPGGGS